MSAITTPARISYAIIAALLLLVGWLHMATPVLTVLFSYFALSKLRLTESKVVAVGLFTLISAGIFYIVVFFVGHAYVALPKIASTAIPRLLDFAQEYGFDLPFSDLDSLKTLMLGTLKDEWSSFGHYLRGATFQFLSLFIGVIVAISLFFNSRWEHDTHGVRNNLYSLTAIEMVARFSRFYESFATVMGAQMVISLINTFLTAVFLGIVGLPHTMLLIVLTFFCGMLPIIGNLLSNAVIIAVALTVSLNMALAALIFLIILHKLEYFLNSKIVGDRIKNPMWLTLLGLLLGERLMGIPGMILAPVVLHYIKLEASTRVSESPQ